MTTQDSFESLPLAPAIKRVLQDRGYTQPSPIQAQAIPHILEGRDILGSAQTGTGKTAAFALPILHRLQAEPCGLYRNGMRTLVLTPTRELALQVSKNYRDYGRQLKLSVSEVYGGVGQTSQVKALRRGLDILVATPGRLLDLHEQGHIDFSHVQHFIVDEADRMLDMGFIHDIRKVLRQLPQQRQSLFFSATLSRDITRLASEILTNPQEIRIAPKQTTAEAVDHSLYFLQRENKVSLLDSLLSEQKEKDGKNLTLVFSRTKHGADRLVRQMGQAGLRAESIHGNKSQGARQRALENFRRQRTPILVATDVASRGIDVKDITLVVNFDIPNEAEAYVHRIGRTARAGAMGRAVSFCTIEELNDLRQIERLIAKQIPIYEGHEYHCERTASRHAEGPQHSRQNKFQGNGRSRSFSKRRFAKQR